MKVEDLIYIAQSAGKILLGYFRKKELSHSEKSGRSDLVTEADLAAQEKITEELARLYPDIPVIGEEGKQERGEGLYFLVDPLDGTLNFFHGIPYFSVSIALMENEKPIAGVVYAPGLGETFYAVKGEGAYFNNERLSLSSSVQLSGAIAATGWPYDKRLIQWTEEAISLVQSKVQEVRIMGSAALEMCYVAAGFIDVYWEVGLHPWDLAAGAIILREAGGVVTDVNGAPFELSSGRVLACGNRSICKEMILTLEKTGMANILNIDR